MEKPDEQEERYPLNASVLEERDAESGLYEVIDFETEFTELEKLNFARAVIGIVAFQFLIALALVIPASLTSPKDTNWKKNNCPHLDPSDTPAAWWSDDCRSFGTFFADYIVAMISDVIYLVSFFALMLSKRLRRMKYWRFVVLLI